MATSVGVASFVALTFVAACGAPVGSTTPTPVADPRASRDAINRVAIHVLETHAQTILNELIAALPDDKQAVVRSTQLRFDNSLGDVNAYATCANGAPVVAVSDGLLLISAHLAMSTATDEVFETEKKSQYFDWLEANAATSPPPGFYVPAHHTDRTKIARQRQLFDEEVGFILGHELAHHYLGHLPCTANETDVIGQVAADDIPLFNQATELAADVAAVKNVLSAGKRRAGYEWTEDGALLVLAAFQHRTELSVKSILLAFERTHPIPALRLPLITTTADLWRVSGSYLPL